MVAASYSHTSEASLVKNWFWSLANGRRFGRRGEAKKCPGSNWVIKVVWTILIFATTLLFKEDYSQEYERLQKEEMGYIKGNYFQIINWHIN